MSNAGSTVTNSAQSAALFACTRCNSRHPFEELSQGQQLCKECRGAFPIVKCTYCRTEFQQESKSSLSSICKKCDQNVKQYGKPTACDYCNIIAAFIGSKCQRCTNSEKKYGPPLTCEQCKQRCAFDRKDPESKKKVDGKQLCWLCTVSYKRAIAKAKQNDSSIRHTSISIHKSDHRSSSSSKRKNEHHSSHHHRHHHSSSSNAGSRGDLTKKQRLDLTKPTNGSLSLSLPTTITTTTITDSSLIDPNNSDNVVAVTQLREKIFQLNRQLKDKDKELLSKQVEFTNLQSKHNKEMRDLREKLNEMQKKNSEKVEDLQKKLIQLQKQNATLSKATKKTITPNDSPLL